MYICMYIENDGSIMTSKIECKVCANQGEAMRLSDKYNVATVVYVEGTRRKLIHTKNREV